MLLRSHYQGKSTLSLQFVGYTENEKGSWLFLDPFMGLGKGNQHTIFAEEPIYLSLSPSTWIEDHKSPKLLGALNLIHCDEPHQSVWFHMGYAPIPEASVNGA